MIASAASSVQSSEEIPDIPAVRSGRNISIIRLERQKQTKERRDLIFCFISFYFSFLWSIRFDLLLLFCFPADSQMSDFS